MTTKQGRTFALPGWQKTVLAVMLMMATAATTNAQTGVGTVSPNANAALEVTSGANNKGFLPPRVSLTARNSASPLSAFVAGMIVYNTNTAGTKPNRVTPGLYYSNGTRWVRLIISKGDQTVDVDGLAAGLSTPNSFSGATFTPNTPADGDNLYVNTADGTIWTYNGMNYERFEEDPSTPFYLANGTTDAGTNKTSKIYRTGSIGIGTINPTNKLHINDTVSGTGTGATSLLINNTNAGPAALKLSSAGNGTLLGQNGDSANGALLPNAGYWGAPSGGHDFQIITASLGTTPASAALTIKNGTNYMGLGTVTPNAPLQFANATANRKIVLWEQANDDHQFYGLGLNSFIMRYQVATTAADHVFYAGTSSTASNELMRITGDGRVGIGTSTPGAPLEFAATTGNRKIVLYPNTAGSGHDFYGFGVNSGVLRYQSGVSSHHIFYAATTANNSLKLATIDDLGITPGADNAFSLGTSSARWKDVWAVNNIIQTSDRNLKTNIRDISYGLKDILKLHPVTYNWKTAPDRNHMVGLIAQEVEKVIPEAVVAPKKEGEYYGMKYTELIPVLIKGMQEQQAQISTLQQEAAGKDQRIAALEAKESAYAQLAAQVTELRQLLGLRKKPGGASTAKK